ncbi:hypothetical protein JAAARDRAFT_123980 [Jaapia argillacea MUCL 33604]|uniref:GTP:AMP phosphotransferase, mitochondrial n=1 Tax=Jaapia argillacea MUCL 33604 TaxID=933084 RepID=A0A067QBU0_9AGAM|nr:hypothetical protein JAAARDRAFT_123980 [Jaapia argillacea MUCL 33604]
MSLLPTRVIPPSAVLRRARVLAVASAGVNHVVLKQSARAFGNSSASKSAIPFSLNSLGPGKNTTTGNEVDHAAESKGRVLRMVMFGKPGAGKGTLSGRLVKKYDILSLSTGDLLRQHIVERTEVGQIAEEIVARGGLLPDEVMLQVITSKLNALHNKHWILDGFPRTLGQGELLDAKLRTKNTPLSLIVNLDVPDEVIMSRISDRWVHLPSGRVYNMSHNRPKVDGFDDATGEPLTKRPDDNPEVFARRLKQFYDSTSPLLSYYSSQPSTTAKLVTVRGETSDEIWPQLESVIKASFPLIKERVEVVSREERRRHSLSDAVLGRREEIRRHSMSEAVLSRRERK